MSSKTFNAFTVILACGVSWYCGQNFWKPLIIEKLRENGALRQDIDIPNVDDNIPESIQDVKNQIRIALNLEDEAAKQQEMKNSVAWAKIRKEKGISTDSEE
ncbi:uncharacterized protein RJT21DRAFT_119180 [Scheffersomyces amazonensis]|uniref:uncharacterized protein n=1 Tax=Scheffersomyces amazonensis TaxID=1078765 RepID=UPI00315D518E